METVLRYFVIASTRLERDSSSNFNMFTSSARLITPKVKLFDEEIFNDFKIYVKFEERDEKMGDEDDVIYLTKGDSHIDLSEVIYDFVHISVPMQNIHPDDEKGLSTCDPKVLAKLESRNDKEVVDPRWEALLKIKDNNKN